MQGQNPIVNCETDHLEALDMLIGLEDLLRLFRGNLGSWLLCHASDDLTLLFRPQRCKLLQGLIIMTTYTLEKLKRCVYLVPIRRRNPVVW